MRIRQIVASLLGNAIKFTEAGGVVLFASVHDVVEPRVVDTGIGIAPEAIRTIIRSVLAGRRLDPSEMRPHRVGSRAVPTPR
nr:ATP-binding protein [Burkholderia diffusa]